MQRGDLSTAPLGAFVKALRQTRKMSQEKVADRAGVGQAYISDIEKGKIRLPSAEIRRHLAEVLGTSNIELLLAAGEIDSADLNLWARREGLVRHGWEDSADKVARLLTDLVSEPVTSPRRSLAMKLPSMTGREAAFLLEIFERLPTEAHSKRAEMSPQAYRSWRDLEDMEQAL